MSTRLPHVIWIIIFACVTSLSATRQNQTDSLLTQLDEAISNRDLYLKQKKAKLSELHNRLQTENDDRVRFDILGELFGEYHSFNADSAYIMAQRQLPLAQKIGDRRPESRH